MAIRPETFEENYRHMEKHNEVRTGSNLAQLNPFIDSSGVIRARGRPENSDIPEDMKTPILLFQRHWLTEFVIEDAERKTGHADNGPNFVADARGLKEMLEVLDEGKIRHVHSEITWKFLPPNASHMAGVWERQIRSTQQFLRSRLSGEKSRPVTVETLCTLLCQDESIINHRPITRNPDSLDDAPALTANMLLTFQRRPVYSLEVFDEKDIYSKRWWRRVHLPDVFWNKWLKEYSPLLHHRKKLTHPPSSIRIDDIVLLEEENTPRGVASR